MEQVQNILESINQILIGISCLAAIFAATKWGQKNKVTKIKTEIDTIQSYVATAYHYVEQMEKLGGIKLENAEKQKAAINKLIDIIPENIPINMEDLSTQLEAYINKQH